jgi:hypothetical protein
VVTFYETLSLSPVATPLLIFCPVLSGWLLNLKLLSRHLKHHLNGIGQLLYPGNLLSSKLVLEVSNSAFCHAGITKVKGDIIISISLQAKKTNPSKLS